MLSRSQVKERQVLIDRDPTDISHLQDLTKHELVAKANKALARMVSQLALSLNDPKAVEAKKLCNGGVVYELNSTEAAHWVRLEKTAITDGFGGMSVVREHVISMIVEYVPVSHSPDVVAENRCIEQDSRLKEGSLLATRWIKWELRDNRQLT